jgi:hypothetical protein
MAKKNENIHQLIRELELGKKKLRLDYTRGIRAIDDAIAVLQKMELDATNLVKSVRQASVGRPSKTQLNVVKLVERKNVRRGRVPNNQKVKGISLTDMLYDTVQSKKRFIHQRDIVAAIVKKYPEEDIAEFSKKISVLLASLKRQGKLVIVNHGGYRRNIYWGLPNWLDSDGKAMSQFNSQKENPKKQRKSV